nr:hypothetical protein [uncultured Arsenicibacter sp.]
MSAYINLAVSDYFSSPKANPEKIIRERQLIVLNPYTQQPVNLFPLFEYIHEYWSYEKTADQSTEILEEQLYEVACNLSLERQMNYPDTIGTLARLGKLFQAMRRIKP